MVHHIILNRLFIQLCPNYFPQYLSNVISEATMHDELSSISIMDDIEVNVCISVLQALQIRKQKRDEIMNRKRSRGGSGSPPFLVVSLTNVFAWRLLHLVSISSCTLLYQMAPFHTSCIFSLHLRVFAHHLSRYYVVKVEVCAKSHLSPSSPELLPTCSLPNVVIGRFLRHMS